MIALTLSAGHVTQNSPISVELIKHNYYPQARPIVVITWPSHVTEVSPAKLGEVITNATRILANASTELARLRATEKRRRSTALLDQEDLTFYFAGSRFHTNCLISVL